MKNSSPYNMFYGAPPVIFEKAKILRRNMTVAEKLLWERLSKRQLCGFRFRCQHPIHFYVADFYCHSARLVVELDGSLHSTEEAKEYDKNRTEFFIGSGITELRFYNDEVIKHIEKVLIKIKERLLKSPSGDLGVNLQTGK